MKLLGVDNIITDYPGAGQGDTLPGRKPPETLMEYLKMMLR